MSENSAVLSLPYIQPSQAQKHVTHNEALRVLDLLAQLVVADRGLTTPPASPNPGDRYIVASNATADWAGQDDAIAMYEDSGWSFFSPQAGWRAHIVADGLDVVFDATNGWLDSSDQPFAVSQLGINTNADATNRLAVASPAALFTHEGAGHRVKVNKATTADTASLLFQSNWSGRAEMGLSGNDDFSIKVSADGSGWTEALRTDASTGQVTAPQGMSIDGIVQGSAIMQSANDTTPGRLMRADFGYGPGNLLGGVSHSSGVPTGAVIERGTNANGDYVRFADGLQICTSPVFVADATTGAGAIYRWATSQVWTFPSLFAVAPKVMPGMTNNAALCWGTTQAASNAAVSVNLMSVLSVIGRSAAYVAVGKWF